MSWIACRRWTSARNSTSASSISATMSWSRSLRTVETRSRFCSSELILSSRAATLLDSRATPSRAPAELLGGVPGQVGQRRERLGQPVGVDLLGGLGQAGERLHDVVRRGGPLLRDLRVGRSWPEPAGSSARYIAPSRVLIRIDAAVSGAEGRVGLDPEGDLHVVTGELDLLDLADPDAGDADLVVGLEPAGLGERRVVGVATADERQVLGAEGAEDQHRDHGEADRPDDHGVAGAEGDAHLRGPRGIGSAASDVVGWFILSCTCPIRSCRRGSAGSRPAVPGPATAASRCP